MGRDEVTTITEGARHDSFQSRQRGHGTSPLEAVWRGGTQGSASWRCINLGPPILSLLSSSRVVSWIDKSRSRPRFLLRNLVDPSLITPHFSLFSLAHLSQPSNSNHGRILVQGHVDLFAFGPGARAHRKVNGDEILVSGAIRRLGGKGEAGMAMSPGDTTESPKKLSKRPAPLLAPARCRQSPSRRLVFLPVLPRLPRQSPSHPTEREMARQEEKPQHPRHQRGACSGWEEPRPPRESLRVVLPPPCPLPAR
jgi:hypothetical protein